MNFSALIFLFIFLPILLIAYFSVPKKYSNLVLLVFSVLFYAWGQPLYILPLLISMAINYLSGRLLEKFKKTFKAKLILFLSVVVNIGVLFTFKYHDFFISTVNTVFDTSFELHEFALPIGISVYTLQAISYIADVYMGKSHAMKNIVNCGTYLSFFPQLTAGPVVNYSSIEKQLTERKTNIANVIVGLRRFSVGLSKKVLLAGNVALLWDSVCDMQASEKAMLTSWLGIIAFSFRIYFELSGFSDMAIGLGKIFGFDFPENFNYPYAAINITDFWSRWNITLGNWFRTYVHTPLGGSKKGFVRQLLNITIVLILTGLWYGAGWNYVLWGLLFGVLLIFENNVLNKKFAKIPPVFSYLYTVLCVLFSWILFAFEDLKTGFGYLVSMFNFENIFNDNTKYLVLSYGITLIICFICCFPVWKKIYGAAEKKLPKVIMFVFNIAATVVLVGLCTAFILSDSYNPLALLSL